MFHYRFSHEAEDVRTFQCEGCGRRYPAARLYESRQYPTARHDGESAVPGRRGALLNYVCSTACNKRAGQRKRALGETWDRLQQIQAIYES